MTHVAFKPLTIRKLADRSEGERRSLLRVSASDLLVDEENGSVFVDPATAERILFDPDTPGFEHEPWPLAGVAIVGDPPARCRVATKFVQRGRAEGWIELEGERVEHRPGGPPEDPWRKTHTFVHADALVLKTVVGDVRYRVVEQPDKWPERKVDDPGYPAGLGFGGDVRWFYELELEA